MRRLRLRPSERVLAWLVTGPVGHFAAGLIDWLELLIAWAWAWARGREL
ncbi:MAG: hypothetical protein ACR2KV_06600 [Solirubrobacteraceae bacterium]